MGFVGKVLTRAAAPFVFLALGLTIFGVSIDGANSLMGLSSLQDQYSQTAPPVNGFIYSREQVMGSYVLAGTIQYMRSDVDQSALWALVSLGGSIFIGGLLIFFDAIFNRPYAGKPKSSTIYKITMLTLSGLGVILSLMMFLWSFITYYISRNNLFYSDINVAFAGSNTEAIQFNTTGYVNQEWYSCYAKNYRNPGGATVSHGTSGFGAFSNACNKFMAARWLTIPLILVSVWVLVSELWALRWDNGPAVNTNDSSSDDYRKEKVDGNTSSDSAPQV